MPYKVWRTSAKELGIIFITFLSVMITCLNIGRGAFAHELKIQPIMVESVVVGCETAHHIGPAVWTPRKKCECFAWHLLLTLSRARAHGVAHS